MTQSLSQRSSRHLNKIYRLFLLASGLAMLLTIPAWGADVEKDDVTLKNAATVLQDAIDSGKVPTDLLDKAKCVIILPNVKKVGFGVGGSGGRGPMSCRRGKNFEGKWSAPAMYTIGGASIGLQVGGTSTDFVLLVMNDKGVDAVLADKTKVGSDATAAAGPSGASSASTSVGGVDMLTYAKAKGLFAGVSLDGATLHPDGDANKRLYGKMVSARDILRENAVTTPEGGHGLISLLDSKLPKR
ncbi:MAG TPA: lipid-binding SYLF domain-containing protein [Candidatus Bathyarchaeia archaeon]|nr:lipid-binding SYLF domain-containing protein [Candidatus Bathyarchaeia archaeon]